MATQPGFDFGGPPDFISDHGGLGRPIVRGFEFGALAAGFDAGFDAGVASVTLEGGIYVGYLGGYLGAFVVTAGAASQVGPDPVVSSVDLDDPEPVDLVTDALARVCSFLRSGDA